jgi:ubiquinone/menaquinone biosynthesis C-methylase UbiE
LFLSKYFANFECVGFDFDPVSPRYATKITRLKGNHAFMKSQFAQADANFIPFKSGFFDFIFATDILEHVDDPDKVLREMGRCLSFEGRIIITIPSESRVLQMARYILFLGGKVYNVEPHWNGKYKNYKEFIGFIEKNFDVIKMVYSPVNLFKSVLSYDVCLVLKTKH